MEELIVYHFNEIQLTEINENEYYNFQDKSVFTTIPWIHYLVEDTANAQVIILRITRENQYVGYFTGMLVKKIGIKIVGSPFRGWSTCFMGLDLICDSERINVLTELKDFLFKTYKCKYIQIIDRQLEVVDKSISGAIVSKVDTLELNINRSDEELFKVFKTDCRNFIRQFERRGANIEIAKPDADFAAEFYQQLVDVFKKQNMVPTYSEEKVKRLVCNLGEKEEVLCLRVVDPDGNSIATSIFPGYGEKCFFWGGASYRATQFYRPNEYMIWTAIKYWRDRGAKIMDMMGVRDYKKKFGPDLVSYNQLEFARPTLLIKIKNIAEKVYFMWLHMKEMLNKRN